MDYKKYFQEKYPYIDNTDLEILENQAKEILIHLLFKSSYDVSEEQKATAYRNYEFWLLRCMQEIIERKGITSVIAYKENGISLTFGQEQLSNALINEITPIVKMGCK